MLKSKTLQLILLGEMLTACTLFGNNNTRPTIPLPPKKISASDAVVPTQRTNTSQPQLSTTPNNNLPQQRIVETRGPGGTVNDIKVNNPKNIPDYYIYPTQQQNLNNNQPNNNISTPTWQINW